MCTTERDQLDSHFAHIIKDSGSSGQTVLIHSQVSTLLGMALPRFSCSSGKAGFQLTPLVLRLEGKQEWKKAVTHFAVSQ